MAFFYLLTLGGFGVGMLVDCCQMSHLVSLSRQRSTVGPRTVELKSLADAYILLLVSTLIYGNAFPGTRLERT